MPYWDWALNATMPDVVNQPSITINTPNGSQSIDNPLYTYNFHPLPSPPEFPTFKVNLMIKNKNCYPTQKTAPIVSLLGSDANAEQVAKWPNTVRYPDAEGRSQPDLANEQLQIYAAP